MSLIPSESLNFPDSFRANVGWRLPKQNGAEATISTLQHESQPTAGEQSDWVTEPGASRPQTGATEPVKNLVGAAPPPPEPVEAAPEPGDQLELIPKSTVEIGVPKEPAAIPESEPQSVLAQLFRLASSTGTLVGPAASPPPAVTKLIQQKPTPAMVEGTTESITAEVAQLSKFPVPHTVDVSVSPEATAAVSSASAPNAEIADAKIQPNESNQPPEPPEESLSSKVESAPPAAPADQQSAISIETPAQANHIFELIAAAVQRGALAGVQVSPQPESTPKEPAPTDLNAAAPVNSPPAASSQSPATPPAS
ncbi:MAG TPA: hypothetical protein VGM62_17215, partial [Chthoniobacterales bacterium]